MTRRPLHTIRNLSEGNLKDKIRYKINKLISSILGRYGYVKVIHRDRRTPSFTDLEALQSLIFDALMNGISMDNPTKATHLMDISRGIVFQLANLNKMSVSDFIKNRLGPVLTSRNITFSIGAGVACFWEVQVKLLAQS